MYETILGFVLIGILIALFVFGFYYISKGNKLNSDGKKDLKQLLIGWIFMSAAISTVTFGYFYLVYKSSYYAGALIMFVPFLVLVGLIVTLSIGIVDLINGYKRDENGRFNKKKIVSGWIFIGVNLAIVSSLIILFIL